jgi:thiol-disulfide isomerase/thioredoxin
LRPVIPFLLLAALTIGGCDKQSAPQSQANETISNSAPAESAGNASAGSNELRRLDRSHKGETAPDVAFLDPAGGKTRIADFKGKPLLMNLWATWCAPCVKEMPTLDALAERLGDSAVVLVLAQDTPEKVDPFFQKAGFKRLQPYIDQDSAMSLTMGLNLPTTILYDSSGREVWRMAGEMDWSNDTARDLIAEAK